MANVSLTQSIKEYLDDAVDTEGESYKVEGTIQSVVQNAIDAGLTLADYVKRDPDKAVKEAEASLNEWLNMQASAAIEGCIKTPAGEFTLNKNTVRLIMDRVDRAQKQLDMVNEIAFTAFKDGNRRRDQLIKVLYNKAINKGDMRAITYLFDRVDGRPGEAKTVDLDYDNAFNVYQIIHYLFDKQLEVLNSGVGTKLVCCSRRAGKTTMLVAAAIIECLRKPNTSCIYIGTTQEQTELLIDSTFNQLVDDLKLRDRKGKRLNWRKFDNGSMLLVRGLSSTKDFDIIRGHKGKVIVIDEFFHMKDHLLYYLVNEVLKPMQMDYADEFKFICAGTPPSVKGTYGETAWKTWEVPHFMWTFRDNPHPKSAELKVEYVENVLKEMGLDWMSPFARREYNCEWVYDDDLLLYPDYHCYDPREAVPQFHIDMVLFGLDYGVSDNDTLIGLAWDTANRRGYQFFESKFNRLDIKDRTISQLEFLRGEVERAWDMAFDFFPSYDLREANKRILWDADDNDQHITDDLNKNVRCRRDNTLRLNIQNAHKTDRVIMYDKIRDLLRTAGLLLIKGSKTAEECDKTVLKRGPNGQVYPEVDLKAYHPDLLPAMRYALWNVIGYEKAK